MVVSVAGQQNALVAAQLSQAFEEAVQGVIAQGGEAEWEILPINENGNIPYRFGMQGEGYNQLNLFFFQGANVIRQEEHDGDPIIVFDWPMIDPVFRDAEQNRITVSAGTLLDYNGSQINQTTVSWTNTTGPLYAEFAQPGWPSWLPYGLIVGGLLLVAAGASLWRNQSESISSGSVKPRLASSGGKSQMGMKSSGTPFNRANRTNLTKDATTSPNPSRAKFCPECGAVYKPDATSCGKCGTLRR